MLENKQIEKSSMREMLVIKIKQMIEEKQKLITSQEALSAVENVDNSLQDGDMNRTGEVSKMSKDVDTARKSKDKSATDAPADPANEVNKSGLSATLSAASLVVLPERDNIDNDFKPVIIEVWRDLAKNYKSQMKRIFRNIRMQREQSSIRTAEIKMQFLEFLHTFDGKQAILDDFVKNFNDFSD